VCAELEVAESRRAPLAGLGRLRGCRRAGRHRLRERAGSPLFATAALQSLCTPLRQHVGVEAVTQIRREVAVLVRRDRVAARVDREA
jgi:hypothetical protein